LTNRAANKSLSALLVILAGILTPWAIGFAGFYDRWQWLSFALLSHPLAVAPLFYFYVFALVHGALPPRVLLHLAAPLAAGAFQLASFPLPLETKAVWAGIAAGWFDAMTSAGILIGFAFYSWLSWRLLGDYQRWIATERSDDDRFAARRLQTILTGAALLLMVWSVFEITDILAGLTYRGLMGLHVAIALLGTILAIEGWRHAHLPFPTMPTMPPIPTPASSQRIADGEQGTNHSDELAARNRQWVARIRDERLYEDPEISLMRAARRS